MGRKKSIPEPHWTLPEVTEILSFAFFPLGALEQSNLWPRRITVARCSASCTTGQGWLLADADMVVDRGLGAVYLSVSCFLFFQLDHRAMILAISFHGSC
jgi:hypothetical protein